MWHGHYVVESPHQTGNLVGLGRFVDWVVGFVCDRFACPAVITTCTVDGADRTGCHAHIKPTTKFVASTECLPHARVHTHTHHGSVNTKVIRLKKEKKSRVEECLSQVTMVRSSTVQDSPAARRSYSTCCPG